MVDEDDNPLYYCSYYGYENYSGVLQGNLSAFLPAASFTYEASEPVFSLVGFNDWDNPIAIGEDCCGRLHDHGHDQA
jgi:hypothetical protein